jgi:hypothetical protein
MAWHGPTHWSGVQMTSVCQEIPMSAAKMFWMSSKPAKWTFYMPNLLAKLGKHTASADSYLYSVPCVRIFRFASQNSLCWNAYNVFATKSYSRRPVNRVNFFLKRKQWFSKKISCRLLNSVVHYRCTRFKHWPLSWPRWIQSVPSHC